MDWKELVKFKDPTLAAMAFIVFAFCMLMVVYPEKAVEKFGYMMAMGAGVAFIVGAGKAMLAHFSRLPLLMAFLGLTMISAAVFFTPDWVFVQSALEEEAVQLLGAIIGLFSKLEEG